MQKFTLDKLPKKVLAKIDVQTAFMASRCVIAAEQLKLFRKLDGKQLSAAAIGRLTGIKGWRQKPFLAALVLLGLLQKKGELYRNSALAKKYFIKERSKQWTDIYSGECNEEYQAFSVLDQMLTTGRSYQNILKIKRKSYIDQMNGDSRWAEGFTNMLYHLHQPVAKALAQNLNLGKQKNILDIGGGSGVMSIALAKKFRHIKATILDIKNVCRATDKIIKQQKLSDRISTQIGDINKNLPKGYDVLMFCDTGILDSKILKKAYKNLPGGGLLILVDYFSSEDLTEPFTRLMWQLCSDEYWLITRQEAKQMTKKAGFKNIRMKNISGESWMITGIK